MKFNSAKWKPFAKFVQVAFVPLAIFLNAGIDSHQQVLTEHYGNAASLRFSIPASTMFTLVLFARLALLFLLHKCTAEARRRVVNRAAIAISLVALFFACICLGMSEFSGFDAGSQLLRAYGWPFRWWMWLLFAALPFAGHIWTVAHFQGEAPATDFPEYAERGY